MKAILSICLFLTCQILTAQNAFIFGEIKDSDTTRIEIWHNGEKLFDVYQTDLFYSLQLGERDHYTIRFSSEGREKYMHLINVGYLPEKIETDIDFKRYESAIVYKTRYNQRGTHLVPYRKRRIMPKAKF